MSRIPLMIMSDAITSPTGLGRIHRELALRINEHLSETFELASLGYGGSYSKKFPWPQYPVTKIENWAFKDLPSVWKDFAGERRGVILVICNPSWMPWLADPKKLPNEDLRKMLESKPFERWIYAPLDAEGPNRKLSPEVGEILQGFDRALCYTKWAAELVDRTIYGAEDYRKTQHLPHGVDTKVFFPRDKAEARATFLRRVTGEKTLPAAKEDAFLIGIVATNSQRKDWGLAFEACQELLRRSVNVAVWVHTNNLKGHWDILGLAKHYGMEGRVVPSNLLLDDEDMAWAYSACTVTFGIGSEGWGYPLAESLACGVPCVHGNYAGGAAFVPKEFLVKPVGFYHDGFYANRRPVFDPADWASVALKAAATKTEVPEWIKWDNCWSLWEKWLLDGVNG